MRRAFGILLVLLAVAAVGGGSYLVVQALTSASPAAPTATPKVVALAATAAPEPSATETMATPTSSVTPLPTVTASSTATATATATPTLTVTPSATPAHLPAAPTAALRGLRHEWQTWNNCGPATLAMALSYFGSPLNQTDIAATLRPNYDDKNVSPEEMVAYAKSQGYLALMRPDGDYDLLKLLLSNGLPVIIETWHEPEPGNGMGHYRLLTGYDDASATWLVYDSYDTVGLVSAEPYGGIRLPYDETARLWEVFGRVYVVIYDEGRAPTVESILGERLDEAATWQQAADRAAATVDTAGHAYAWFNLGTALTASGRYDEAAAAFDRAREIGLPKRMFWYQFAAFRAYLEVGRYQDAISLADATLAQTDQIEELWYWKGLALEALGQAEAGRRALETATRLNPNSDEIARALASAGG